MTESVILQHRARFCYKSLFYNCAMYLKILKVFKRLVPFLHDPSHTNSLRKALLKMYIFNLKLSTYAQLSQYHSCSFNRKSMKYYKTFCCAFLPYSTSLIYKRNYGKGTKIVTIFTIIFLKICYCFRINYKLRILQLFRDYKRSVNLQAPCVLYIRTGISLLSRERLLYI
jgi:hypothetical protein